MIICELQIDDNITCDDLELLSLHFLCIFSFTGEYINGDIAADWVCTVASTHNINSFMIFEGEPLLHSNEVCKIHAVVYNAGIIGYSIITNGFFNRDEAKTVCIANVFV